MTEEEGLEEYKYQANLKKDAGNVAFEDGNTELAISLFTQAIDIDPDNVVFYSNRSAAYMKVDSVSKALHDAEKCVDLDPNWPKGYNRLGVAQQKLKRFDLAIDSFKKGIELDPNNHNLWAALKKCQEAKASDQKLRFSAAALERDAEEKRLKHRDALKVELANQKRQQEEADKEEDLLAGFLSEVVPEPEPVEAKIEQDDEDDLLAGFFNEVTSAKPIAKTEVSDLSDSVTTEVPVVKELTEKYSNQDLGDGRAQCSRIMGRHHEWRNLNPYFVLQLGIDATDEDIKLRYKKLSLKVHPDRLRDVPNARESFEQVKDAYMKLCDETQKKTIDLHSQGVADELNKERRKLIQKGAIESDLPNYDEELTVRLMKHFAEIERMRQRSETNLRAYSARDKMQEAEEQEKFVKSAEFDKNWSEDNRRDNRIGDWRSFQTEPEAKKAKTNSFREERSTETKHGVVKTETWKKTWK